MGKGMKGMNQSGMINVALLRVFFLPRRLTWRIINMVRAERVSSSVEDVSIKRGTNFFRCM